MRFLDMRCATRSLSSRRSVRPQIAHPDPAITSGSKLIASVHCGGTEIIWPSGKRSSHRFPDRFPRFAMHSPTRPECGWKGWVTVTRCSEDGEKFAFPTELQNFRARIFSLADGKGRCRSADFRAIIDACGGDRLAAPDLDFSTGKDGIKALFYKGNAEFFLAHF